jgi:UDP-N-acetylglucosamine 3-dehydrogenase
MGATRAAILAALPNADLVVCCDLRDDAAASAPEGVPFTADVDALFSRDLDALFVSTPDGLHRDLTVRALEAGIDVFCEKPLATTLEDADAILESAARGKGRLVVGHSLRADPRYRSVRDKVASGELGTVVHASSRRWWPLPEGQRQAGQTTLPRYLSVHELDMLQWTVGEPIVRVYAEASETALSGLESRAPSIVATLKFAGGAVAAHECSWGLPDQAGLAQGDCALSVAGSRGVAYLAERDHGVVFYGGADGIEQPAAPPFDVFQVRGAVEYPEARTADLGALGTMYGSEVARFLEFRTGEAPALTTGDEARSALAAVIALEASIAEGRAVDVDGTSR